jgi:hypothetical protein
LDDAINSDWQTLAWYTHSCNYWTSFILLKGNMLLIYSAMLISQVVSFDKQTQPNSYIPWSQWSSLSKIWTPIQAWANAVAHTIDQSASNWQTNPRTRSRIARTRSIARNIHHPQQKGSYWTSMLYFTMLAMQANGIKSNYSEMMVLFNTDSVLVGIDNQCTGCISKWIKDFEGLLVESNWDIKGCGGSRTTGIKIRTIAWKWLNNDGKEFKSSFPSHYMYLVVKPGYWVPNTGLDPTRAKGQFKEPGQRKMPEKSPCFGINARTSWLFLLVDRTM